MIGVRGGTWRGTVDARGAVVPVDGGAPLRWAVAADDRWHDPAVDPGCRQRWYAGTPVAETRLRIPGGDLASRAYCTADLGGLTVLEFENESPMPVVVAVSRGDLLTSSPGSATRPTGIEMPDDAIVVPLGHRATARVALVHDRPRRGALPPDVADAPSVVRGWESATTVASWLSLPDLEATSQLVAIRCDLLLSSDLPDDLHGLVELARLGEFGTDSARPAAAEALVELTVAAGRILRRHRRARTLPWDTATLLANIARCCLAWDEPRAADDIAAGWLALADVPMEPPPPPPSGAGLVSWWESHLARPDPAGGRCTVFPVGMPRHWWGQNFEFRGLTADPRRTISAAVRWHGERPALLWEIDGPVGLVLETPTSETTTTGAGTPWCSTEQRGETLLAAP